ncbi:hypothetical protein [Campylobacter sp. MG1]|uniref:hypothetical protein n=1 Tax=Campylobacter sp. MG1 TaxID=2976332 RepID=UPI00226CC358|nr:hypothetical protein [Campylobacter sp. MG1]
MINIKTREKYNFKNIYDNKYSLFSLSNQIKDYALDDYVFCDKFLNDNDFLGVMSINEILKICDEKNITYYNLKTILDDFFYDYPNNEKTKEKYKDLKCLDIILDYANECFDNAYLKYEECNESIYATYFILSLNKIELKEYLINIKNISILVEAIKYDIYFKNLFNSIINQLSKKELEQLINNNNYEYLNLFL